MALSGGPLERRSMSNEAYIRLREAIVAGELQPGERLRDYELAARLGTSKTPIRHALDRLADNGLVEMQRNRYTRVAPIDLDRVRNTIDLFADIWVGAVRRVLPRIYDGELSVLVKLADVMSVSLVSRDAAGFFSGMRAAATRFAFIEGNDERVDVIDRLVMQIHRFSQHAHDLFDWTAAENFVASFRKGIATRDVDGTGEAVMTLFDEVLPAVIDRAEELALAKTSDE